MFKDYYESNRARHICKLDETLSILSEAEDDNVPPVDRKTITKKDLYEKPLRLTEAGLKVLFSTPLEKSGDPIPGAAAKFFLIDTGTPEGKETLESYKSDGALKRVLAFSEGKSTFRELPGDMVDIPKEYFAPFMSKERTSDIYQFAKKFYDSNDKNTGELKSDSINHIRVTKKDAIDILKFGSEKLGIKYGVYNLQDVDSDTMYQVIYPLAREAAKIGFMFNVHEDEQAGAKLKIKGATQENETHTLLGFFYDAEDLKKKIDAFRDRNEDVKDEDLAGNDQFQKLVEPYATALDASDEFNNKVSWIKKAYKMWGYEAWYKTLSYGIPASKFKREIVKFNSINIVCKSMGGANGYRKLEEQLMGYKESKVKVATSDALVASVPAAELLALMNLPTTTLHGNDTEGSVHVKKNGETVAMYYQLSLKTKESDQLGRAQSALTKKYKFAASAAETFKESEEDLYDMFLKEGLISKLTDAAKSGLEVLKKIGKEQFSKMLKLTTTLKGWSTKLITNIKTFTDSNLKRLFTELYDIPLNEDEAEIRSGVAKLLESGNKIAKYNLANNKIVKALEGISNSKFAKHCKVMYNIPKTVEQYDENLFYRQIFNYAFVEAVKNLVIRSVDAKHMEDYIDELVDLYADSVFGASVLPVWRMYSTADLEGSKTPWEYLGTKASNTSAKKKSIMDNLDDSIPLTVIKATSIKGGYHHFYLYTLTNIVNTAGVFEPMYMEFIHSYDKNSLSATFRGRTQVKGPITAKNEEE